MLSFTSSFGSSIFTSSFSISFLLLILTLSSFSEFTSFSKSLYSSLSKSSFPKDFSFFTSLLFSLLSLAGLSPCWLFKEFILYPHSISLFLSLSADMSISMLFSLFKSSILILSSIILSFLVSGFSSSSSDMLIFAFIC